MQTIIALAFVAALCSAASFSKQETAYKFDMFKKQFNKVYKDSAEESARMAVFSSNLDFIEKQNELFRTGKSGFTVGVNEFADLTSDEFAKLYLSTFNTTRERNVVYLPEEAVEATVDWRTKGAVTPVKNQGQCGSCWSFSTTGSTEGAHAIASGNLVSLSEQQLMDCSTSFGNQGCNGGLMDNAFKYIVQNGGLDTEEDYPYTAQDGTCNKEKEAKHAVSIKGYKDVPQDNEAQLKAAVTKGPVSVAIEADQQAFQLYKSGVFDAACGTRLDHGVLVVGYGTEGGKDYWIVKNSWGASWGLQGYILMAQGKGAAGECGIAMQPSYPEAGSGPAPPSPPSPGPAPPPPSPPSPPSSHHYGAPPCLSDETAVQITGISGDFCSPKCSLFKPCTTDVPPGTTAKPQCVLEAQGHSSPTNCALVCTPGENNGGCPTGATCQPIQGTGICTYPAA